MRTAVDLILASLVLLWLGPAVWAEGEVPQPLTLDQALSYAPEHPRSRLGIGEQSLFPRRAPLYLDCHRLAYGNMINSDYQRNETPNPLLAPQDAQRLEIMQRFFDVLLAEVSAASDNEHLAIAFNTFDRARNRKELGQYSELSVAQLEAEFRRVLLKRNASETTLRLTRSMLAQAINHPANLPRDLIAPKLPLLPEKLPEMKEVFARAQESNSWLERLKADGAEVDRQIMELDLRQHLLELLSRLDLLKSAKDRAVAETFWRDLAVEHNRALYEQEVKADLGLSISQQTRARLEERQVDYCQMLAWSELQALQGQPVWRNPEKKAE